MNQQTQSRQRTATRSECGSTLVELALVLIVFLLLLFGIVDMGRLLYTYHFLDHAAKSATRWAAVNGYTCSQDGSCSFSTGAQASDIQSYVQNLAPGGIDSGSVGGCGGSASLNVCATWPVQSSSSTDPSPPICSGPVSGLSASAIENYPGCTVQVTVSYNFSFLVPMVHSGTITLSSTSAMVIAH